MMRCGTQPEPTPILNNFDLINNLSSVEQECYQILSSAIMKLRESTESSADPIEKFCEFLGINWRASSSMVLSQLANPHWHMEWTCWELVKGINATRVNWNRICDALTFIGLDNIGATVKAKLNIPIQSTSVNTNQSVNRNPVPGCGTVPPVNQNASNLANIADYQRYLSLLQERGPGDFEVRVLYDRIKANRDVTL